MIPFLKEHNWSSSDMLTTLGPFEPGKTKSSFSYQQVLILGVYFPLLPTDPQLAPLSKNL